MIVKVRLLGEVGEEVRTAIVTDESGSEVCRIVATRPLLGRMNGRGVAYFEATRDGPRAIDLRDVAPDQAW